MDEQAKVLSIYRLKKAKQVLNSADMLMNLSEDYNVEASDILGDAFNSRNESDYRDFFDVPKEEAELQLSSAKRFLEIAEAYLKSQGVVS